MKRRIFTIILSLAMMVSLMPVTALAAGDGATLPEVKDGKITLVENVTLENEWLVTTDTVLDLNGYTLSSNSVTTSDYLGAITLKSGNLTIEDSGVNKTGRVEGARFAVVVQGGTLTVNNGTFGKTPSATNNSWNEPLFVGGGSATINGGTFVDGTLEYYQIYDEPGSLVINGGQFDSMPYYPAGNQGAAILAPAPDHNYMVAYAGYGDFAAQNSSSFTYDSATNTLTLTSDYNGYITKTGDWCGFFLNKDVTIDLNGHTWDMKTSDSFYPFPFSEMVTNGGTEITIQDSSGTDAGTLKNRTGNVLEVMGTLHFTGGTLEQVGWTVAGPTVQLDGNATVNMTGGTVKGTQSAFKFKDVETGTPGPIRLSISGGKIETNNSVDTNNRADATCDITGGSFKNPIEEALCANGYLPVKNEDGTYTVKKSDTMVASVTDSQGNVTEYVSLGKALGSAAAGDTVTLLTDLELQPYAVLGITEKVVLDLAGHSIHNADFTDEDADPPMLGVASGAELTVRDSRGSGIIHNVPLVGECDSTIRFESGTIDNSDLPDYWGGISVSYSRNYPARPNKALVTITGGTIKAAGSGIFMDEGTLEVTGGTISGTATGVTVGYGGWAGTNSSATAAISGGTITGGTNGIDVLGPASQVTVSGGTITGTEDNGINAEKYGTTPTVAVQGGTLTGGTYGIYASCGNQASFTVSGGFVGGTTSAMSVSSGVPMSITGGYYTSDPSEYVAEGYRITSSDESNYAYKVIQGKTDENVVPSVGETAVNMDSLTDLTDDQKTAIEASAASTTAKGLEAQAVDLAAAVTEDQKDAGSDALTDGNISTDDQTVTIHAQTYLVVTPKAYAEDAADKTLTLDITAMSRLVAATTDKADDIKLTDEDGNQKNAAVIPDTEKVLTNVTTPVTISIQLPSGFVSNTTDPVYVQHKGYEYTAAVTSATENSNTIYTATFISPHGFSEFTITAASAAEAAVIPATLPLPTH